MRIVIGRTSVIILTVLLAGAASIGGFFAEEVHGWRYRWASEQLFKTVLDDVADFRGLSAPQDASLEVVTVDWVKMNWGGAYREGTEVEDRIYKSLFIIPEDVSLAEIEVDWAGYIVSAVVGKKLYVVKERFDPSREQEAKRTLAHEVMHILQGEHFKAPNTAFSDEEKAWVALIEGDADLTADMYSEKGAKLAKTAFILNEAWGVLAKPEGVPDSVMKLKGFPYRYGKYFVQVLFNKGGWNAVNQAYGELPRTQEQILHPEKYLRGEAFSELRAPNLLGTGLVVKRTDRLGEYFVRVMLAEWVAEEEAVRASEGWRGDNLTFYESRVDYLLAWSILWDSSRDASEFSSAFRQMMSKVGGEEVEYPSGGLLLWTARQRYIAFAAEEDRTTIVITQNRILIGETARMP